MLITFIMIILSSQIGWNMTIYDDIDTHIEVKSYLVNGLWRVSINNERVCHFMYIFSGVKAKMGMSVYILQKLNWICYHIIS